MLKLSQQSGCIVQSEIRIMSVECERAGGVNLAQGICDTPVPAPVVEGAARAMRAGLNAYVRLDGIERLRRAVSSKLRDYNRISADPEREVLISSGSTGAFYAACAALLDPKDEVIVFEPYYGYHVNTIRSLGASPVFVTLSAPEWSFSEEDLRRAITSRTKAIVLNTPANPSGKVFSRAELEWLRQAAIERDLFVFTDEIYEYFLYDGREHVSIASLPGMAERTITISGFSKTFSITGWRIGYAACDQRWKPSLGYFHDLTYICAPSPLQHACADGLEQLDGDFYAGLRADYANKRALLCEALTLAGLEPCSPQGSYYVLADAASLPGEGSKARAMYLLEHAGVAAVPGEAFYGPGKGKTMLRFCYAKTDQDLAEACGRLARLRAAVSAR